jgi:hypothetical protein
VLVANQTGVQGRFRVQGGSPTTIIPRPSLTSPPASEARALRADALRALGISGFRRISASTVVVEFANGARPAADLEIKMWEYLTGESIPA